MEAGRVGAVRIAVGAAIVLVGLLWLLGQLTDINIGALWPFFVIIPGAVVLLSGLAAAPGGAGVAATVVGSQLTAVGLLLLFQNITGLWQTWAYGWALIWPTSIGVGLVARGGLSGDHEISRNGMRTATVGIVIFLVGFAFFEGILNISGSSLGLVGDLAMPAVLIGLGIAVILRRK
jgi:hypothetical protein